MTSAATVSVVVPEGYEDVVLRLAESLWTAISKKVDKGRPMDERVRSLVDKAIAPHLGKPEPGKSLASATNSRRRNWFVDYKGVLWPVKALYIASAREGGFSVWDNPREFNTIEAREFFEAKGFNLVRP